MTVEPPGEKLQKVLARAGLGSRRELERWIEGGRVTVNGVRATLGDRVSATDSIRVDGRRITGGQSVPAPVRVLRYHKPAGEICSRRDPEGRPTVFARLPRLEQGRWVAVGRLDFNSSGLLLFTNDGTLAHRLAHPSSGIEREYAVRVRGDVTPTMVRRLKTGVELDDGSARFARIEPAGGEGQNQWYHVVVTEGRNREVRRLWESQGVSVGRLIRVRIDLITLPRALRPGRYDELGPGETRRLHERLGLEPPSAPDRRSPNRRHQRRPHSGSRRRSRPAH